ncbi:MAG: glutamine-hydrolyzing carbamoyl-phosphate synthase small subunit [Clostridia bacterium]
MKDKMLVLENGKVFYGEGFGGKSTRIAELVFNTCMVGYQEIISDPCYAEQIVVMSYPLIGNYGLADEDYESKGIFLSGLVVREYNDLPSNFRYTKTLSEVMLDNNVSGIADLDTREIVKIIRDEGEMLAMITDSNRCIDECLVELKSSKLKKRPVELVSTQKVWYSRTRNPEFTVVAVDCGIKYSVIKKLNEYGCNVVIVPFNTSFDDIVKLKADGLFITNGPGNPMEIIEIIELINKTRGKMPIFGLSLGCQLIGLAYGATTYKMKFGHRGSNIPVKDLETGKVEITTQNHSYALNNDSLLGKQIKITHINLLDNEAEGVFDQINGVIGMQYHPESAEGTADSILIFEKYIELLRKAGGNKNAQENRY